MGCVQVLAASLQMFIFHLFIAPACILGLCASDSRALLLKIFTASYHSGCYLLNGMSLVHIIAYIKAITLRLSRAFSRSLVVVVVEKPLEGWEYCAAPITPFKIHTYVIGYMHERSTREDVYMECLLST